MTDRVTIYQAAVALHGWCRGANRRREYAAARAAVPAPSGDLTDPIERQVRALLAMVPPDRRSLAIRRCQRLAPPGLSLYQARSWASTP
jgi:hypothetical protein